MEEIVNKYQILVVVVCFAFASSDPECTTESSVDLTVLKTYSSVWISHSDGKEHNFTYKISVCSELNLNGAGDKGCHAGTSVCLDYGNGTMLSAGNVSSKIITENKEDGDVWYLTSGDPCPESPSNNLTTQINFRCGLLIGAPEFLDYEFCVSYFQWESHIFCKGDQKPVKDVPCYVYDDAGNRYDLSPLALQKDGYLISSEMNTSVWINVCRDIKPDTLTSGCPSGAGSCRKSGNKGLSLGSPSSGLQRANDGRLILHYTSPPSPIPGDCTTPPSTSIAFTCPKHGGSKDPLLLNDFDCVYVIEWETEYACPEATLVNSSCVLINDADDINIDLTPLKKPIGVNYAVNYTESSGTTYTYYLNVCGELNIDCPDKEHRAGVGACQTKVGDSDFGYIIGKSDHQQLRYADNKLTLTYKGGSKCHHNNFQRVTVIEFICNNSAADNGRGFPVFVKDDDCRYFFEWQTKYACLNHPVNERCRVRDDTGTRYDLSSLVRTQEGNWMGLHDENDEYGKGQYYINVCHNVLRQNGGEACDPSAAVCYREILEGRVLGSAMNLGRYVQNPRFDKTSGTVLLQYTNGDPCGNGQQKMSTIYFICKPGELQSGPVLVHVSDDKCFYDFEWQTAAACRLGNVAGYNCKVDDTYSGITYDLSALRKEVGSHYTVSDQDGSHDFLINVCGPVTNSLCDSLDGVNDVGICQVPSGGQNGTSYSAGRWSSMLTYYDGMINLTYSQGSPYHDAAKTPRKSEITFLCDQDAGVGRPKYLAEIASDHYYGFEWRTSYACPQQPMECTVTDNEGREYDLSPLALGSNHSNWVVSLPYDRKRFNLNVCRTLNRVHVKGGCNTFASACTTKIESSGEEVVDVADFGHIKSGLTVESLGRVKLVYEGGKCNSTANYKTTIHFICKTEALTTGPDEPIKDGPCGYSFVWFTAAACPLGASVVTEKCTLKDERINYVYNLQPLQKGINDAYSVAVGDTTYKLNICGGLSASVCGDSTQNTSVCQVDKDGTKTRLAEKKFDLEFNEDGRLSMTYEGMRLGSGDRVKVQIDFQCQPGTEMGEPEFMRKEGDTYMFRFLTSLACRPMAVDCLVQDENGNQYNLGALSRQDAWSVLDRQDPDTKYYINVCKPVNNILGCPDEPIGGCQYASNGKQNMGYIQSKPIARSDGSLTITYRNGDVCHHSKPNESHRSTRINFYCSPIEEGPVYEMETEFCEYIFTWRTPAACKLQSTSGQNCIVDDPLYHYAFDLNPLRRNGSDYLVHAGDFDYAINVCGPLQTGKCDHGTGVGVCQTKPADGSYTPVNLGKGSSSLQYSSGEISLTYDNGQGGCKTIIKFACDYSKNGNEGPMFIEKTRSCEYIFVWPTQHACPPYKIGSCYTTDKQGNNYDLSGLTMLNDNYEVMGNNQGKNVEYVINVCHSVIHKKDSTCPFNAAACMIDLGKDKTDKSRYINIGEVNSQQVQFRDNYVHLIYTNGDPCGDGHWNTTITFMCNKNDRKSLPSGHYLTGNCTHHFLWSSVVGCPVEVTTPPTPPSGNITCKTTNPQTVVGCPIEVTTPATISSGNITCKTTNPQTGKIYDLSSLKVAAGSNNWVVNDTTNHMFEFNVCGPLTGSKCSGNSDKIGVCQSEIDGPQRTFSGGNSVNDVYFQDEGVVVLNYSGGDRCHHNQFERNTIVTFVCNNNKGLGKPVYLGESNNCTYFISWHTNLVCENQVKCSVLTDDFHTIDLSPLASHPDNIVHSSMDGAVYFLSVCTALTPKQGVMCPPGAGACEEKPGNAGNMNNDIGRPKSPPTYDRITGKVTMIYTNGSKCDYDPTQSYTTKIVFSCLPGPVRQSPMFVDKVGCQYIFEWPTSVVCLNKEPEKPTDQCGFQDYESGLYFNFTLLAINKGYYTTKDSAGNTYYINPCKPIEKSGCSNGMVCRERGTDHVAFGFPKSYAFERQDEEIIKMTYAAGGICPDGVTASSEILFKCNRDKGVGKPQYFTGIGCRVQFIWETNLVCPEVKQPCTFVDNRHLYDLSVLSKDNGAWNVSDTKGNSYWLNICSGLKKSDLRLRCGKDAAACIKRQSEYVILGSVNAQKPLYRDSKTGAIVLEYSNGGNVCSNKKRRSENNPAKTRINFICGNTYGGPVFNESPANQNECLFEFTWKTKIACEVEREKVAVKNGTILDPHSGGVISIQPLLNTKFTFKETLQSGDTNIYEILLNGTSKQCTDGVVCLLQAENKRRVLGTYSSRKFYVDDDALEAVYTSSEKCSSLSSTNVTSIIQFHCNSNVKGTGSPVLISRSKDCVYIFSWDTPMACLNAKVIQPTVIIENGGGANSNSNSAPSSSQGGAKSHTAATVIGVFTVAIAVCILVVVFHKQERRAACFGGVKRIFVRERSEYSQLPTAATDDFPIEEDDVEEVVTVTDASETSTNREEEPFVHVSKNYHDDSDEDLLL